MHPYSATMTDRPRAIALWAMTAAAMFLGIGIAIDASGLRPPFWITTPSAMALFGLLFGLFDRKLWRRSFAGFRFSNVPDLNGKWGGRISIQEGERRPEESLEGVPCFVCITQTWSTIRVEFETPFSRSWSSMASIDDHKFRYEFTVERKEGTGYPPGMKAHSGIARMHSRGDWTTLEGDFYNDESYQRSGPYRLVRLAPSTDAETWLAAEEASRGHAAGSVVESLTRRSHAAWSSLWRHLRLPGAPRSH